MRHLQRLAVLAVALGTTGVLLAREIEIQGTNQNGPVWKTPDGVTKDEGKVGDPTGRLQIKVKNGDTVRFVNKGGHNVILENAVPETAAGVWEVLAGSGDLIAPKSLPDAFDAAKARQTKKGQGNLVTIKIKGLKPGANNGILFACDPHSTFDPSAAMMLGVIVLEE